MRGTSLGTANTGTVGQIRFSSSPSLSNSGAGNEIGIVPYLVGDTTADGLGAGLVTYGQFGLRTLTDTEYSGAIAANKNVRLASSATAAGSNSIRSLVLTNTGLPTELNLDASSVTTITSDAILSAGSVGNAIHGGTLTFASNSATSYEGIITTMADLTIDGAIVNSGSNPVSLTKSGSGTLSLGAVNSYTGATTINAGTLRALVSGALGTGAVAINGGTLDLSGTSSVGAVTLVEGRITGTPGNRLSATSPFVLQSGTVDANLAGSVALNKKTAGTVALGGSNSYSGGTNVSAGILQFDNANAIPSSGTVAVAAGAYAGANFTATQSNFFNRFNKTTSAGVIGLEVDPSGPINLSGFSDSVRIGTRSSITLSSANTITPAAGTYRLGGGGGVLTVNGSLSNGAGGTKSLDIGTSGSLPSGTVILNAANTYSGTTYLSGGTLQCTVDHALGTGPLMVLGGWLDLGGSRDTIGTLTLNGGSIVGTSGSRLTTTGTLEMKSGSIGVDLAGAGPLNKTTAGIVLLSGSNSFTGGTNVSAGMLSFTGSAAMPVTGDLTVAAGAYLGADFTVTQAGFLDRFVKASSLGVIGFEGDANGPINLAGFSDSVRLGSRTSGTIPASSTILPPAGTYRLGGGGGTLTINSLLTDGSASRSLEMGTSGTLPAGTVVLGAANTYTGATVIHSGTLRYGIQNALPTQQAVTIDGGQLDLDSFFGMVGSVTLSSGVITGVAGNQLTSSSPYNMQSGTIGANLAGSVSLNKTTVGTVLLNGSNSYAGGTNIQAGMLTFGDPSSVPLTGRVMVGNGGYAGAGFAATQANFFDRIDETFSNGVLGLESAPIGGINLLGFNDSIRLGTRTAVTLDSANPITPVADTYRLGGGGGVLTLNGPLGDGASSRSLEIGTSGSLPAGTVVLGANNTYSGTTTISAGTLRYAIDNALPTQRNVTINGGALDLGDYSGTVNTLTLANGAVIGSTSGRLVATSAIELQNGNVTVNLSGSGRATKTTSGTVTFDGSNSYTGGTDITAGVLIFGNMAALPQSGTVTVGAGAYAGIEFAAVQSDLSHFDKASSGVIGFEKSPLASIDLTGFNDAVRLGTRTSAFINSSRKITPPGSTYRLGGGGGTLTVGSVLADGTGVSRSLDVGTSGSLAAGTVVLTSTSTYSGRTMVNDGTLLVNGSIQGAGVTVDQGATLGGSGRVPSIAGAGLVSPGTTFGILTASSLDPSAGLDFAFELSSLGQPEYTHPTGSVNDLLRLLDGAFTSPFNAENNLDIYFDVPSLVTGGLFDGGFFTDGTADFLPMLSGATTNYFVKGNGHGTHVFNNESYYTLSEYNPNLWIDLSTTTQHAIFAGGVVDGRVTQFVVVPEPSALVLMIGGLAGFGLFAGRRLARRRGRQCFVND